MKICNSTYINCTYNMYLYALPMISLFRKTCHVRNSCVHICECPSFKIHGCIKDILIDKT